MQKRKFDPLGLIVTIVAWAIALALVYITLLKYKLISR